MKIRPQAVEVLAIALINDLARHHAQLLLVFEGTDIPAGEVNVASLIAFRVLAGQFAHIDAACKPHEAMFEDMIADLIERSGPSAAADPEAQA